MRKELSEMTLEELWDLFPIFLVQHDVRWSEYFKEIEAMIADRKIISRRHTYLTRIRRRYIIRGVPRLRIWRSIINRSTPEI